MKEIIRMLARAALPERVVHKLYKIQQDTVTGPTKRDVKEKNTSMLPR